MSEKVTAPDKAKWTAGLVVFVLLVLAPVFIAWGTGGGGAERPELLRPKGECVESVEFMRESHMDLLNDWRDEVVRRGNRGYTSSLPSHKQHEMSLTNTCLSCHTDKSQFCDRCHDYVGLSVYCWDCHVDTTAKGR